MSIQTIELPSGGRFYNDRIPGGELTLSPMRAKEEAVLFSEGANSSKKLDLVLKRLLIDCPVKPEEFLLSDRAYILLVLRTQAHGAKYRIPFRCEYCKKQTEDTIDIAQDLSHKEIPEDLQEIEEPVQMKLPRSGDTVEGIFLRGGHEQEIARYVRRVGRKGRFKDENPEYLYRLALQLQTVNGEPMDLPSKLRYVGDMLAGDVNYFVQYLDRVEPGLDFRIWLQCQECGAENQMNFPYNEEFFRPKLGDLT